MSSVIEELKLIRVFVLLEVPDFSFDENDGLSYVHKKITTS
jgi:hypothetical protein